MLEPKPKPKCHLVHGWNHEGGANTVMRFESLVEERGWKAKPFQYSIGWFTWHPLAIHSLARRLASDVSPGDIAIGNSMGASIIFLAIKKRAPFKRVILLNANLDSDAVFPQGQLKRIFVWYSPGDEIVTGKGAKMPWSPFGKMGATGHVKKDPRVTNYNKEEDFAKSSRTHSDLFTSSELFSYFAPLIVENVPDLNSIPVPKAESDAKEKTGIKAGGIKPGGIKPGGIKPGR